MNFLKTFFVLLILTTISCKRPPALKKILEDSIKNSITDLGLKDVSYTIVLDGDNFSETGNNTGPLRDSIFYKRLLNEYTAPVLLDMLIRDSVIKDKAFISTFPGENLPAIQLTASELISIPANVNSSILDNVPARVNTILSVIGKGNTQNGSAALVAFNQNKVNLQPLKGYNDFLINLLKISYFFDKYQVGLNAGDTTIRNISPTWYTRGLQSFYGWRLLKFQKHTILWNFYSTGNKKTLLLKMMEKKLFVAISYQSDHITSPYAYHNTDLLQSPLALVLLNILTVPENHPVIDLKMGKPNDLYKVLQKNRNSPFNFLLIKQVLAYARYYDVINNTSRANELYDLYKKLIDNGDFFPYKNAASLARIDYATDYLNAESSFELSKDSTLKIFAAGQALKIATPAQNAYQYDNVQIFLNAFKKNGSNEVKTFEFNYLFDKLGYSPNEKTAVKWLDSTGVKYAFSDPDIYTYLLEVSIPWSELSGFKKGEIKANVLVNDSDLDEDKRKSVLSWFIPSGINCFDPSQMSSVKLKRRPGNLSEGILNCLKTVRSPQIEGLPDQLWEKVPYHDINKQYVNKSSAFDHAASFKTLYDEKNIYFLFKVTDNCKNQTGIITKDKCWIENAATKEIVWKMGGRISAFNPSFDVTDSIRLKAGKYTVKYITDKGHSSDGWYGKPPVAPFYGIGIYYCLNPKL
ncbi:sugar-binding protein [Mucilaginibacter psychrotolerans]|uniref:Carbohydrate-binding domain-containing protein n=1 Tax=Mucilaginibacter psychrotolerans TaxID=1524096 RepID=A0A4Y8SAT8_9SPHI|nr:sugar-binding protein [Mucilaginibacter psychrotolerans]TFF36139.1 hypothetical protein E2R66_16470 [Mucilaginibacter psychrotolerans]